MKTFNEYYLQTLHDKHTNDGIHGTDLIRDTAVQCAKQYINELQVDTSTSIYDLKQEAERAILSLDYIEKSNIEDKELVESFIHCALADILKQINDIIDNLQKEET